MSEENTIKKVDYSKNPVVLSASHVSKCFKLPTEQATGLKQAFINWARGIKGYKKQEVLKDISFEVHQGEFFGIVGRNGGGKSTLLNLFRRFTIRKMVLSLFLANWFLLSNWEWDSILNSLVARMCI